MSIIDEIIDDSPYLSGLRNNKPEEFKDISIEKLNSLFDNTNFKGCIKRISPLYEGLYPEDDDIFIQLINDLDYLISSKRINLLVFIRFSFSKNYLLTQLNRSLTYEYNQISFKNDIRTTIISLGLVDMLKNKKFIISNQEFVEICIYGHLETIKYILEQGDVLEQGDIDIHYDDNHSIKNACCNKLDVFKYLIELSLKRNQLIEKSYKQLFIISCERYNIEVAEYIRLLAENKNIEYISDLDLKNLTIDFFIRGKIEIFKYILELSLKLNRLLNPTIIFKSIRSGNIHMIEFLINFTLENNIQVTIDPNNDRLFSVICWNLSTFKLFWEMNIRSSNQLDIHFGNNHLFNCVCENDNFEMISYLQDISLQTGKPFIKNTFLSRNLRKLSFSSLCVYSNKVNNFLDAL